jgi:glycosyltransferase involved in cell wall biosynthesis
LTIVQIVRSLELGGLERLAVDLAIAQKVSGYEVSVYSVYKHQPALLQDAERAGIRVVLFHKTTGFSPSTIRKIAIQLRRDRATIVHTHNELVHTYGAIAGRLAGVPCILNTIHGAKGAADRRLIRNYRMLLPWTNAVVCVSAETSSQFAPQRARYSDKFHVIRNGIPIARFAAQSARPGAHWPRVRIGTVGRLVDIKDQATLIRAFHKVSQAYPLAELHFLGDGPLRGNLQLLSSQLGISHNVIFQGTSPNVPEFLGGLDVFALSSLSEGLPLAVLEAMAVGLPIVSTRVGGICEVAPEHEVGEYCSPADPEALAHALQSVLDPDRLKVMGRTAQDIAQRSFSLDAMWRAYEHIYRSLASKKSTYLSSLLPRFS